MYIPEFPEIMGPQDRLGSEDLHATLSLGERELWCGTSKSWRAIHKEMEKQMCGEQMFAGPS